VTGAAGQAAAAPATARRSRWSSALRILFEFALMFGIAVLAKQAFLAAGTISYPNPLWLPVIVLSLQHGLVAGLAAAIIAAGLQFWGGPPPPLLTEDMYSYIARIAAEPMGWTCVALLIGHIRSRQIASHAELEAELAECNRHSGAVADLCLDLRARAEMLERHIAANGQASSIEIAEAIAALDQAGFDDFAQRLTRFVVLMTGAAEFSVYLMRAGGLGAVFQPAPGHKPAADVGFDDPLFAAVVNERRIVWAARPADAALIGDRGILAGPLIDANVPGRVVGMLVLGDAALDDQPADVERRFALTAAMIARQASRISLIDDWQAAAAPSRANGHGPTATHGPAGPPPQPDDEYTLQ
jgi:hypothetical protein